MQHGFGFPCRHESAWHAYVQGCMAWPPPHPLELSPFPSFTIPTQRFVEQLHQNGQRWVPIVDPGIKASRSCARPCRPCRRPCASA